MRIFPGIIAGLLTWTCTAVAQPRSIDVENSGMTVRVSKAGLFSAFGHDHEIAAPITGGIADIQGRRVELRVNASMLRVRDADASDKDRQEIQKTMLGPEVLDVERYPQIVFRSAAVETAGAGSWTVPGELALHGQTRRITVQVREQDGHYVGTVPLKQSDFGIKPVKAAGGTVTVKDEVRIEFDIRLAQAQTTNNPHKKGE
jgi:polyisoprenoid-binding protein YceI